MAIKITDDMKALIDNAMADGVTCLLGTATADGHPQISPKGSVLVFDEETLAYWERSHRSSISNIGSNPHVVVYYRNSTPSDNFPRGAVWRFYGTVTIHDSGPVRDQVYDRVIKAEQDKDPDKKGTAVTIQIARITDLGGRVLQER